MNKTHLSLALVLSLAGSIACGDANGAGQAAPKKGAEAPAGQDAKHAPTVLATRVEVATIRESSAEIRLVRPGEVESARDVNLAAPMGGLIEKMSLKTGDKVKEGEVIAKVDTRLMSAQAQLAHVEVKDAERELERLRSAGKAIARVRVEQAETRLERAKAQARIASIQSDRTFIRAPFAATVADVIMEKGEVAPPGAMIARLVTLDPAVVNVSVADRDVGNLSVGGDAMVTAGGAAQPTMGKIVRIDPTADLKTRAFKVEVEVPNADERLKPGMIASVDFRQQSESSQLIIPQHFLVTKLDANGVFVVDENDVARWRELQLGSVVRDQVIVESGLKVGDRVVIVGQRALVDGDKLIISREGVCCTDGRVAFPSASVADASAGAQPADAQAENGAEQGEGAKP